MEIKCPDINSMQFNALRVLKLIFISTYIYFTTSSNCLQKLGVVFIFATPSNCLQKMGVVFIFTTSSNCLQKLGVIFISQCILWISFISKVYLPKRRPKKPRFAFSGIKDIYIYHASMKNLENHSSELNGFWRIASQQRPSETKVIVATQDALL